MECVFGLVGDGFAVIAADTSAVNSILVHKSNEDKIMILDSHKLMGASGESGRSFYLCVFSPGFEGFLRMIMNEVGVQFTEYIQKNVHLYQFRYGIPLTTATATNFT